MVTSRHYSSAFAGPQNKVVSSFSFGEYDFRDTLPGKYHALDTARQALIPIRRLYPQACIREYQEGKLGPIIDINIDHRINDKTYDAR